ncbi:MAG: heme-dependent peroxidase [Luteitalea sp.]|nr:heme-dependent peroxidase [Luteitalea sp.]
MPHPTVPATLEGWSVLHQMFRLDWPAWLAAAGDARQAAAEEAVACLQALKASNDGHTAAAALLGHKGDLMLLHCRRSLESLLEVQLTVARLQLARFLVATTSYVSVVELGMYEMTAKLHEQLTARGLEPESPEYDQAFAAEMAEQQPRVASRLMPELPRRRYVCFYPMSKRRGEHKNWYATPFTRRAMMMREHGAIGRRYAGQVVQIISGSIGFDDWEWGVDLFADDPLVFKRLVYEMRFDEASADYGEFGAFYVGLQFAPEELSAFLDGRVPGL